MSNTNSKNTKEILVIALKLLVICSIVATIIAAVNAITKDKIKYNEQLKTADALSEIYSLDFDNKSFTVDGEEYVILENDNKTVVARCSLADCSYINEDIKALYVLKDANGNSKGYCVSIEPMGFKDAIKMLVAVNDDMTVKSVKIVSMSETKNYGTRAMNDPTPPAGKASSTWFLEQFEGKNEPGIQSADIISGATKTSKPIINAVQTALNQVNVYNNTIGGNSK
ncbi:MAG: FMN-binding protein [Ruminococcaceae bacterium]|nr:FMN-binding protein [Oscillospiraceae bacterium]